jgi:hypothetical protein
VDAKRFVRNLVLNNQAAFPEDIRHTVMPSQIQSDIVSCGLFTALIGLICVKTGKDWLKDSSLEGLRLKFPSLIAKKTSDEAGGIWALKAIERYESDNRFRFKSNLSREQVFPCLTDCNRNLLTCFCKAPIVSHNLVGDGRAYKGSGGMKATKSTRHQAVSEHWLTKAREDPSLPSLSEYNGISYTSSGPMVSDKPKSHQADSEHWLSRVQENPSMPSLSDFDGFLYPSSGSMDSTKPKLRQAVSDRWPSEAQKKRSITDMSRDDSLSCPSVNSDVWEEQQDNSVITVAATEQTSSTVDPSRLNLKESLEQVCKSLRRQTRSDRESAASTASEWCPGSQYTDGYDDEMSSVNYSSAPATKRRMLGIGV